MATTTDIASAINTNAALQTPGTMGGTPAGKDTGIASNPFVDQLQSQLGDAQGAISSESASINEQIQKAIGTQQGAMKNTEDVTNRRFDTQQSLLAEQQAETLDNARTQQGGFATNSALLERLNTDSKVAMNALEEQRQNALQSGDTAFANAISSLQQQQAQMDMQNRQNVYQNLIAAAGANTAAGQLKVSQQQLQATIQNDIGTMATKYGVKVNPGDTLMDIINNPKVLKESTDQEQLTLSSMRASITAQNAQANLANAQASTINMIMTPDMISPIISTINSFPKGINDPSAAPFVAQLMAAADKNNTSFSNVMKAIGDNRTPHDWSDSDFQTLALMSIHQNNPPVSVDDAIANMKANPSVGNTAQGEKIIRAAYGAPDALTPAQYLGATFQNNILPFVVQMIPGLNLTQNPQTLAAQRAARTASFSRAHPTIPNPNQ